MLVQHLVYFIFAQPKQILMSKLIFSLLFFLFFISSAFAQTREELERQRNQLKKELEETESLLKTNKTKTNENLLQWRLINQKVTLQDRLVNNLNNDLKAINNNLYTIQKEINHYDRLLDTLRQEYAKSMVYAYKNRSNYDFLNFIFSADNFNDAMKRIAYLKSYRDYREMQGQNILRTQIYRQKKIDELSKNKKDKSTIITSKSDELKVLEKEEQEKDRIVVALKKTSYDLGKRVANKKTQMKKVENVIAAVIKKARDDARKEAQAKAAAEERKRKDAEKALAAQKAAEEKSRVEAEKKALAANKTPDAPKTVPETKVVKPVTVVPEVKSVAKAPVAKAPISDLLNSDNLALNASFERNKGSLPWPVDRGYPLMHFGRNKMPSGSDLDTKCVTIACEVGAPVKSIFAGEVVSVMAVDDMVVLTVQHGKYFSSYSNLNGVSLRKGDKVSIGQVVGKATSNLDGQGIVDFYLSDESKDINPEQWLRKR